LSSPYEFFAACEGYFDKIEHEMSVARLASYRIHQSLVTKALKIEQYWPLESDKKPEVKQFVMTQEERDRILKLHQGS